MIKQNLSTLVVFFSIVTLSSSSAKADISETYPGGPQIIYQTVNAVSLQEQYGPQGPMATIVLEYNKQIELQRSAFTTAAKELELVRAKDQAEAKLFIEKQVKIDSLIKELVSYVGVTEYGFGDSPELWDCSGLTKWYLAGLGIDAIHSATAQVLDERSEIVDSPITGDLVAFQKFAEPGYFHIGVYLGGGLMVHASNPEKDTNIQSIQEFADVENSTISFIRY